MSTVKRITDLSDYTTVLPYASEIFGVYQPLLGWKSKRIEKRFKQGLDNDHKSILDKLKNAFAGVVNVNYKEGGMVDITIAQGLQKAGKIRSFDSIVLQQVAAKLPAFDKYQPAVWAQVITSAFIDAVLKKEVVKVYTSAYEGIVNQGKAAFSIHSTSGENQPALDKRKSIGAFEAQLQNESSIAGALLYLVKNRNYKVLADIFY